MRHDGPLEYVLKAKASFKETGYKEVKYEKRRGQGQGRAEEKFVTNLMVMIGVINHLKAIFTLQMREGMANLMLRVLIALNRVTLLWRVELMLKKRLILLLTKKKIKSQHCG